MVSLTLIMGLIHQTWLWIIFDIFQHLNPPSEKQAFATSQACKKKALYILEMQRKSPNPYWARKMSTPTSQVTTATMQVLISLFEDLSCHFRIRVHTYSFCGDCHQVWFAQESWPESRNFNFEFQTSYDIWTSGSLCKSLGKPEQPTRALHQLATPPEVHRVVTESSLSTSNVA